MRGQDFDHTAGWLTVCGKGGETKHLPIHPEITRIAAFYPEVGYWFPGHFDPTTHVEPRAVSATIKNAMLMAGIDATAHRLRDTAGTQIQREGRDLRVTQAFLRHASVMTTQKYLEVSDTALQKCALMLDWAA